MTSKCLALLAAVLLLAGCGRPAEKTEGQPDADPPIPGPADVTGTEGSTGHAYVVLSEANFQSEVLSSDKPVLVDFYADWCPPCRAMAPIVEQLAGELSGRAVVAKLNTDSNPALAQKYGVQGIPTFIVFHNGQEVDRTVGGTSKENLLGLLQPLM